LESILLLVLLQSNHQELLQSYWDAHLVFTLGTHEFYIRRMRVSKSEALYTYLAINHPELLEDSIYTSSEAYVCVPIAAPKGAITRHSESAIQFLERVKLLHEKWIKPGHVYGENTHNVSASVTMKPNEWGIVGEWLWENQNHYNGLSFMPQDLGSYQADSF
jgi:ribonucleoside-triphosphate reductase (thioredoxin)